MLDGIRQTHRWPALTALAKVTSEREVQGKTTMATHAYLRSKKLSANETAGTIPGHWQIENNLHWSLVAIMNDDYHWARKDKGPINFAALRCIALNIIKTNWEASGNGEGNRPSGESDELIRGADELPEFGGADDRCNFLGSER